MDGGFSQETLERLATIGCDYLAVPIAMSAVLHQMVPEDDVLIIDGDGDPLAILAGSAPRFHGNLFMVKEGPEGERRFVGRRYESEEWGEARILNPKKLICPNFAGLDFTLRGAMVSIPTVRSIVVIRSSVVDAASEAAFSAGSAE